MLILPLESRLSMSIIRLIYLKVVTNYLLWIIILSVTIYKSNVTNGLLPYSTNESRKTILKVGNNEIPTNTIIY